eukprot:TRINITY_DN67660_c9_g15_i1.p1 TRINITY_DN67660_c9_g15~~TRINITY_DN67660_c9_g15_i1.p1  ORF type:complete len:479 (+),score=232.57 TRINITY_DN67660_c9_g15_i1:855-2291(+)
MIPCNHQGTPLFSRNVGRELWVMMAEKAYAKLHGSYARLADGTAAEAMEDLTGCPAKTLSFDARASKTNGTEIESLYATILSFSQQGYAMCAGSKPTVSKVRTGIVPSHFYSVLSIVEYGHYQLVRLRNPWGKIQWKGDWSAKSALWTDEIRRAVADERKDDDDGEFWMSLEDFKRHFANLTVCYDSDRWHVARHAFVMSSPAKRPLFSRTEYRLELGEAQSSSKSSDVLFGMVQHDERPVSGRKGPYWSAGFMVLSENGASMVADSGLVAERSWHDRVSLECGKSYRVVVYSAGALKKATTTKQKKTQHQQEAVNDFALVVHCSSSVALQPCDDTAPEEDEAKQQDGDGGDAALMRRLLLLSVKRFGKANEIKPGLTTYQWTHRKHLIVAVEMTADWQSDRDDVSRRHSVKFTSEVLSAKNLHFFANDESAPRKKVVVDLHPPASLQLLHVGAAIENHEAWTYKWSWKLSSFRRGLQ